MNCVLQKNFFGGNEEEELREYSQEKLVVISEVVQAQIKIRITDVERMGYRIDSIQFLKEGSGGVGLGGIEWMVM